MTEKWDENVKQAEKNAIISKPEYITVAQILKEGDGINFQQLYDQFVNNYTSDLSKRQLRYILSIMEENETLTVDTDKSTGEKFYFSVAPGPRDVAVPIPFAQGILLCLVAIIFAIERNSVFISIFIGVALSLLFHQFQYAYTYQEYKMFGLSLKNKLYKIFNKNKIVMQETEDK
jgi:hypothetical protein